MKHLLFNFNTKLLFILLNLFLLSSCEDTGSDMNEDDNPQIGNENEDNEDLFSGSLVFTGANSGTGTLNVIDDACEFSLSSNTRNLSLTLEIEEGVITSGQYVLNIATEITETIVNNNNCNPVTFDETHTGTLTIDNNSISFSESIGTSTNVTGISYAFSADFDTESQTLSNANVTHSSNNLETDITYTISYATATNIDEVLVLSGTAFGDGVLQPVASECEFNFRSNTNNLTLILNIIDGNVDSGTYSFEVQTDVTGTIVNNLNCNPPTFNETWDGALSVDNNTLSFSQAIGTTIDLEGVNYSFEASYTNNSISSNTITHSSGALESDITYSVSF